MFTTIQGNTRVTFGSTELSGDLQYDAEQNVLALITPGEPAEILSINLGDHGLTPQADTVFVKDWSEHFGVTASLVASGAVEVVRGLRVGPFDSPAFEVRILSGDILLSRALAGAIFIDSDAKVEVRP